MILIFLLGCLLIGYMFFLAHDDHVRYHTTYHSYVSESFEEYTIFFIADVHRRLIRKKTLAKVNDSIDIVCIGGDLLEKGVPLHRVRENIRRLKRWKVPIYFVWGNNDEEVSPPLLRQLFRTEGVIILEDEMLPLVKGDQRMWLTGFRYNRYPEPNKSMIPWDQTTNEMTILLTHKPVSFDVLETQVKYHIDLVLTGHTHGGQIRLFGFGPYVRGGWRHLAHTSMLVTEGYGYSLLPFRLGTRAECHVIHLRSKHA